MDRALNDLQNQCHAYAQAEQQWAKEKRQFENLQQVNQQHELKISSLNNEIKNWEESYQILQNQHQDKDKKISELQQQLSDSDSKKALLAGEVKEMRVEFKAAEKEISQFNRKIVKLEFQIKSLQLEADQLHKDKQDSQVQAADLRTDKVFLQKHIAELVKCR